MSIKALNIETVFSGSIHLLWLTLLTLMLLGKSPDIIFSYLSKIDSGTAVLLAVLLFSVSFFIGRTAEHFIIAVNYFSNKAKRQGFIDSFKGTKEEIWGNKIFFFSSALGLLTTTLSLLIEYWNERLAIIIIGVILIIGTTCSFIYWFCFGRRVQSIKIIKSNQYWLNRLMKR
jgi:hypothetical protein